MKRATIAIGTVMFLAMVTLTACKKGGSGGGGGGSVSPAQHQATITQLEAVLWGPGKNGDGNDVERLANAVAQEIILKATEGPKADPERAAAQALMAYGSAQGVAANDNKYTAAEARAAWIKLRDSHFAPAPWFKQ